GDGGGGGNAWLTWPIGSSPSGVGPRQPATVARVARPRSAFFMGRLPSFEASYRSLDGRLVSLFLGVPRTRGLDDLPVRILHEAGRRRRGATDVRGALVRLGVPPGRREGASH